MPTQTYDAIAYAILELEAGDVDQARQRLVTAKALIEAAETSVDPVEVERRMWAIEQTFRMGSTDASAFTRRAEQLLGFLDGHTEIEPT